MRIAIITPAFNAAEYIADAIGSVLEQTYADWRLIVVDDGSTDSTAAVAQGFGDSRISVVRQRHAGVSAARNRAMDTNAEALLFLDADDRLAPDGVERLAAALKAAPHTVAAVGAYVRVTWRSQAAPETVINRGSTPSGRAMLTRLLVANQFANGGHVLIRADAAKAAGCFRQDLSFGEDWEYWVRLALQGPFTCDRHGAPVLYVRSTPEGAYRRLAANPASAAPCLDAIFGNPTLRARFSPARLKRLRRRADAENQWVVGRELVRQGRCCQGMGWLWRSVAAAPYARRFALLALACAGPLIPSQWRGPFIPYPGP